MKHIGITANCGKPGSGSVLQRLAVKASAAGITLYTADETGDLLPGCKRVAAAELGRRVEGLLALGGDGTMLRAVRMLQGSEIPVLGVNLGSLGFLTSVTENELEHAVDVLQAGTYQLSVRSLIEGRVRRGMEEVACYTALNDIVVGWGSSSRALTLGLAIDGEDVAQYLCDGMIVSTPTGSTGHSLSAGGPIVHPSSPVITVNVICPHTLSARPLVLSDQSRIQIMFLQSALHKRALLSADGQGEFVLEEGDLLEIRRSAFSAHFAQLPEYRYFSVLSQKLHWRGSAR